MQLNLFENTGRDALRQTVPSRNESQRTIKHGIVVNPTARGCYYAYWWNAITRTVDGAERIVTKKKPIRGAAVGTVKGEDLKVLVQSWIACGLSPLDITRRLVQLPRSARRQRDPDWSA